VSNVAHKNKNSRVSHIVTPVEVLLNTIIYEKSELGLNPNPQRLNPNPQRVDVQFEVLIVY
jgi:hypothetical protein